MWIYFKRALLTFFLISYISGVTLYSLFFIVIPGVYNGSDVMSFLTGAEIIKSGNSEKLFDRATQFYYQRQVVYPEARFWLLPFRSPPIVAYLFLPFTFIGVKVSYYLLAVINIIFLLLFAHVASQTFNKLKITYLIFLAACVYWPFLTASIYGQFTPLLLLVLLVIFKNIKVKHVFLAGVFTGILFLKPQYLLIAPFVFFMIKDRQKYLQGLLVSALFFLVVNLVISGRALLDYPAFLVATEKISYGSRPYQMFTLYGLFKTSPFVRNISDWGLIGINFFIYTLTLFLFSRKIRPAEINKGFIIATLFTILFSVHALTHDLILLLVPILILWNGILSKKAISSYSNFEKTLDYQPGDESNLICRPPLEGNRGLLVRGGRHKIILFILYFLPLIIFLNNTFIAVLIIVAVSYFLMLSRSKKFALAEQN